MELLKVTIKLRSGWLLDQNISRETLKLILKDYQSYYNIKIPISFGCYTFSANDIEFIQGPNNLDMAKLYTEINNDKSLER